nr:MAG TPA: hypothetical protein [Caudoviricetes sp.]
MRRHPTLKGLTCSLSCSPSSSFSFVFGRRAGCSDG